MDVFIAHDQYDNMTRVCVTPELAKDWLEKRAESTWGEKLQHDGWSETYQPREIWLMRQGSESAWPYRVTHQGILGLDTPVRPRRSNIVLGEE